jgi:hypothetical protein
MYLFLTFAFSQSCHSGGGRSPTKNLRAGLSILSLCFPIMSSLAIQNVFFPFYHPSEGWDPEINKNWKRNNKKIDCPHASRTRIKIHFVENNHIGLSGSTSMRLGI